MSDLTAVPPPFDPVPLRLEGRDAVLVPLARCHAGDLLDAGSAADVWRYMPRGAFTGLDDVRAWIDGALDEQASGTRIPFAIVERAGGRAVGSTSYLDISRGHRTLEIGWTWIASAFQRTGVNTQCKLLLLAHAFEVLGANRVQLKTDRRNVRSQRAIERIGGVREGVLRRNMILASGHVRDSVYYSIIGPEWPAVKARLERLARPRASRS